ncbi:hypothetical protein [Actinomadura sp. RB99]|uniref:hypothetical protein n=1 Tax=Actinomadura sp. RB99 TaxID=2691577 RepID=UPI001682419F|nr:hypothetical protein [Actinomadura sp. RB99]
MVTTRIRLAATPVLAPRPARDIGMLDPLSEGCLVVQPESLQVRGAILDEQLKILRPALPRLACLQAGKPHPPTARTARGCGSVGSISDELEPERR